MEEEIKVSEEVVEQPVKKKRGRPKRDKGYNDVCPCKDFQPYIYEIFKTYLHDHEFYIDRFIDFKERVDKDFWMTLQKQVSNICDKLKEHGDSKGDFKEYNYRTKSQWRGLDNIRENQRKKFIKDFYTNKNIDDTYKSYMIFMHFKTYIIESSKEMLV